MTPKQAAAHRRKLEALRAEVAAAAPARIEGNRSDETQVGTSDEDAQALNEMLQTLGSQRNKGKAELLARIDRALAKLAAAPAEFGLCEECGDPIASRRLEVVPDATLCIECQAARDPRRGGGRRTVTDYK